MKKLICIIVLGLLWGGVTTAEEIILNCENYRVIGYYKNGGTSDGPGDAQLNKTFKINSKKKLIYELNSVNFKFFKKDNTKWNEGSISWKYVVEKKSKDYSSINRYDLTFTSELIYYNNPKWKRIETFAKCKIGKKKF